jgi:glycosyltransferase involved in cell wall biosynthesis
MNILFLTSWYPSRTKPGAGVFVKDWARAASLLNEVVVLTWTGVDPSARDTIELSDAIEDGIRTLRVRYRPSLLRGVTQLRLLRGLATGVRRLIAEGWRPDVIHAHVYSSGFYAVLIGAWFKIPVVITEHYSGFPRGLIRGIEKTKAKFAFRRTQRVIAVSKNLATYLESYGAHNIAVIPNPVDTSMFSPGSHNKHDASQVASRALFVGGLVAIKNVGSLLRAIEVVRRHHPEVSLTIVGDGEVRKDLENLSRDLGIDEHVHFLGRKDKVEVAAIMRESDFLVLPSLWENQPCVVVEAMATGLPVVASDVGGIPETVPEYAGILVKPGSVEELAEAIETMIAEYSRFDPHRISKHAHERYGLESIGKLLHDIYSTATRKDTPR